MNINHIHVLLKWYQNTSSYDPFKYINSKKGKIFEDNFPRVYFELKWTYLINYKDIRRIGHKFQNLNSPLLVTHIIFYMLHSQLINILTTVVHI